MHMKQTRRLPGLIQSWCPFSIKSSSSPSCHLFVWRQCIVSTSPLCLPSLSPPQLNLTHAHLCALVLMACFLSERGLRWLSMLVMSSAGQGSICLWRAKPCLPHTPTQITHLHVECKVRICLWSATCKVRVCKAQSTHLPVERNVQSTRVQSAKYAIACGVQSPICPTHQLKLHPL